VRDIGSNFNDQVRDIGSGFNDQNNTGMAKVKIVKNERDPPLFTSKQMIKF
jgi:hypothetical protein